VEYKYKKEELRLFWYFLNERHMIYAKRKHGDKYPWTKDKVLKTYKFTNLFRQLDRVTQEWTRRYMHLLAMKPKMKDEDIFFWLCVFRFFNWPETYDALYYELGKWNMRRAIKILDKRKNVDHEQLFTGAYIITGGGKDQEKHVTICEALDYAFMNRRKITKKIMRYKSMEKTVEIIREIPTQGPFTAYEIACDLRHTKILHNATDVNTWANAGPGAKRGIHRLLWANKEIPEGKKKPDYNAAMRDLLVRSKKKGVLGTHIHRCEWPFEAREIEHSLCEFDKMRRVMNGEGRPRSLYHYKDPALYKISEDNEDE
jgi:hypothetical protein